MNVEQEHCVEGKKGEQPEKRKRIVLSSLKEYIEKQLEEARMDYNKWFAGEDVGHDPDMKEMFRHYVTCGGAKYFAERYTHPDACTDEERKEWEREQREKEENKKNEEQRDYPQRS